MNQFDTGNDRAGVPEPVLVRGPVQAVGPQGLKVAGRWFHLHPGEPMPLLTVGQLVCLEARGDHFERLTVLAEPEPHQLGQRETITKRGPAATRGQGWRSGEAESRSGSTCGAAARWVWQRAVG